MNWIALAALLLLPCSLRAESIAISHFLGLHDDESSVALDPSESQDCLNVECNHSATAIIKRPGYATVASLPIATAPVNGSFSFTDPNGNRQDIVCQENRCYKSTNQGSFAVFLSTAGTTAAPTRWSFVSVGGTLYGANDQRDAIIAYDGTTLSWPATMPKGSILDLTQSRLVVADVSAAPNRVYYSSSGAYTMFTPGINSYDPYYDDIGSNGDGVTGVKWARGKLYIFKTQSITACILGDQYTSRCYPASTVVGTRDPASVTEAPDGIYFRGNDRQFWRLDDNGVHLISKNIGNIAQTQTAGSIQNNTQTSQNDWDAGAQVPATSWNTNYNPGSVLASSFTLLDQSSTSFNSGTISDVQVLGSSIIANTVFSTGSFCDTWVSTGAWSCNRHNQFNYDCGVFIQNYKIGRRAQLSTAGGINLYEPSAIVPGFETRILKASDDSILYVKLTSGTGKGAGLCWYNSIDASTQTVNLKLQIYAPGNGQTFTSQSFSPTRLPDGKIHYGYTLLAVSGFGGTSYSPSFLAPDQWYARSSTYTSQCFDTAFTTPTWGPFSMVQSSAAYSVYNSSVNVYYSTIVSTSCSGTFDSSVSVSSGAQILSGQKRYVKYNANFVTGIATQTAVHQGATLQYATTGQFHSQCIQPGSAISAWGSLNCAETKSGGGSLSYYVSTGATCSDSRLDAWTAQANNATVGISTAPAFKFRFDSLLTSATDQAQVDACTLYWTNGTSAQPVWGVYDSNKNAMYFATSINNSATNNRFLKYDLNWNEWFPMDLPVSSPRIINGLFYFGSSNAGYWNQYGPDSSIFSDNGAAINSYWKSKDYGGSDPFVEKNLNRISVVTKNRSSGSLGVTYQTSNAATGTYNLSLSTTSTITYVRANYSLPLMSPHQLFNVKFGNNSAVPWEIDAYKLDFSLNPWKPNNP